MAHILIVEDDPLARELLTDLLQSNGYVVSQAEDWISTVESLRQGSGISVIILDVNLPGLSGDRIAKLLSSNPDRPRILLHSGLEDEELQRIAREIGASGYLSKGLPEGLILGAVLRAHTEFVRASGDGSSSAPSFPPPSRPPPAGFSNPPLRGSAPLFPPPSQPPPAPDSRELPVTQPGSRGKVLVCDADAVSRAEATRVLEAAGFQVVCVEEWVGLSEEVFGGSYQAILLDVSPGAGDASLVAMLRESKADCPPVLLWGSQDGDTLAALAHVHGAAGALEKVRASVRLVHQVRALLR